VVFLSTEGVRLGVKGYAGDIHEEGFAPLRELMASFVKAGGSLLALLQEARPRRHGKNRRALRGIIGRSRS
jgi:predicted peroxiredoxin